MPKQAPVQQRDSKRGEWQYKQHWIGREAGSKNYYRYWYQPKEPGERRGRVNRASLGTPDFTAAQEALIRIVDGSACADPKDPAIVPVSLIRVHYMEGHGNFIRSRAAADRAFELLLLYMKEHMELKSPKIGQFTLAHQEDFMRWCSRRKLSAKSIATYLSMIKAGVEYCARPRVTADHRGKQIESRTITTAPFIQTSQREVCRVTGLAKPVPREFIPSDAELAAFLDAIFAGSADRSQREHIFRYCIIALNTWARPEAICELDMKEQVKLTDGLVDLNTKGRAQNNKYRPTIRLTDNLRGWLLHWNEDRPIRHLGQPVKEISPKTFKRIALRAGLPEMVRYTLRHYCNTRAMNVPADIRPDREERAIWMGHHDPRHSTTMVYEHRSPDYLMRCAKATDAFMTALDNLTEISLFAPNTTKQGLYVIEKRA